MAPRLEGGGEAAATTETGRGLEDPAAALVGDAPIEATANAAAKTAAMEEDLKVGQVVVVHAPDSPWFDHCYRSGCRKAVVYNCSRCVASYCRSCLPKHYRSDSDNWVCPQNHTDDGDADFAAWQPASGDSSESTPAGDEP